jgi:hypothetical protein
LLNVTPSPVSIILKNIEKSLIGFDWREATVDGLSKRIISITE